MRCGVRLTRFIICANVTFFTASAVDWAGDVTDSTSRGVFRIHFVGKVLEDAEGPKDVTITNSAPLPHGVKAVRVRLALKEMVEAHVYNSISLSPADFQGWKGREVVIDRVEFSSTLKQGHDLAFRMIGVMDYGKPVAHKVTYFPDTKFRASGEPFTDENLTYPIEQVQDPLLGPTEVPRRARFGTIGELAQSVIQSVVRVDVMGDFRDDGRSQKTVQTGTGFMIDRAGHIVTNYHVVENYAPKFEWVNCDIRVEFRLAQDGRTSKSLIVPATLIGKDPDSDLVVLKVEPNDIPQTGSVLLSPDKSQFVQSLQFAYGTGIGEEVVAVGFSRGTAGFPSVTRGIVGAVSRSSEGGSLGGMIQTDAAINTGNSGGPLLDLYGNVVGINTSTVHHGDLASDPVEGISFARSYITASEMSRLLIRQGRIDRRRSERRLGFAANNGDDFGRFLSRVLPLKGVMIGRPPSYVPDGNGPIQGDFVTGIDTPHKRYAIESKGDLDNVLAFLKPGEELTVHYTWLPDACRDAFTAENRDTIPYKDIAGWRRGLVTDRLAVIRPLPGQR